MAAYSDKPQADDLGDSVFWKTKGYQRNLDSFSVIF